MNQIHPRLDRRHIRNDSIFVTHIIVFACFFLLTRSTINDQARILARQYKELSEKEMRKWEKKAEADKERYQREMVDYVPTPDPTGGSGKSKRSKKDPNAPKRNSK